MALKRAPVSVFRDAIGQASTMGIIRKLPQGTLGTWGSHILWFPKRSWKAFLLQEEGEIHQFSGQTEEELTTFLFDSNWIAFATPVSQPASRN